MGFFDTVKDRAGALAADAERAGKVTAAQTRLVVLQNDLRKAERAFGQEAFALVERGELEHPELAGALARLRATTAEVHAKEAEIAALRGAAPDEPAGAEAPTAAPPPSVTVADAPEPVVPEQTVAAPAQRVVASPVGEPGEPPLAKKAPARKPAARPAGKKVPAKKAAPKKPAAGKPAAPKAPAPTAPATAEKRPRPAKGGAGSSAGATAKKSGRPSTSGPRPAGKNKPAGS